MKVQCHIGHPQHLRLPRGFRRTLEIALGSIGKTDDEAAFILCDDTLIRRLNLRFLNSDETTDVLSFDLGDPQSGRVVGEIYVNLDRVRQQAPDYEATFREELIRVAIHGLLHLYGYDDHDPGAREVMMAKQEELLQKCQGQLYQAS
jgi:probable rRNA maturation factor